MKQLGKLALVVVLLTAGLYISSGEVEFPGNKQKQEGKKYCFHNFMDVAVETDGDEEGIFSGTIRYLYSQRNQLYGSRYINFASNDAGTNLTIIADNKNQQIAMIFEDKKQAMLMSMGNASMPQGENTSTGESYKPKAPDLEIKKTGKTKKILGYTCHQYTYEDDKSNATLWINNSLHLATREQVTSRTMLSVFHQWNMRQEGTLMEMRVKSKQDNSTMHMQVKELGLGKEKMIDLSDYNITDIGSMGMPQD